jgi:hypothetical protein
MSDRDTVTFDNVTLMLVHIVGWEYDPATDVTHVYTTNWGVAKRFHGDLREQLFEAMAQGRVRNDRRLPQ